MIRVYGIKNCDSVKKALQFFDTHGIAYAFHDFKTSPVGRETIEKWAQKSDVSTLLNTKGTTYRILNLKSLLLDDDGKVEWMGRNNLLVKRPVIEFESRLVIGFDPSLYEGIFLS